MVVLLRLAPVVPFAALNYALGATGIPLWTYTWASALGIIPGVCSRSAAATTFQTPGRTSAHRSCNQESQHSMVLHTKSSAHGYLDAGVCFLLTPHKFARMQCVPVLSDA
jgi:hypothetical protein